MVRERPEASGSTPSEYKDVRLPFRQIDHARIVRNVEISPVLWATRAPLGSRAGIP